MKLNNEAITLALRDVQTARNVAQRVIQNQQSKCKHSVVAEGEYQPEGIISYAQPPIRVCVNCGISEDGWQLHKILKTPEYGVLKWTRDQVYDVRIGEYHMQDGDVQWIF